jgi:uncharacterized protein (TIGR03067 family)
MADIEELQGTWSVETLQVNGGDMPSGMFKGAKIEIEDSRFTTSGMGETYSGAIQIDASQQPKTLDMIFTSGVHKGLSSLGIYELNGQTWTLCLGFAGKDRPKGFATKAGSHSALETLKRESERPKQ